MFHFDEDFDADDYASGETNFTIIPPQHLTKIFDSSEQWQGEEEDEATTHSGSRALRVGVQQPSFYDDYFLDYTKLMMPSEEEGGDGVHFLEHPQSVYVVRSQPAQLTCKAMHARRLRFRCNNKWLEEGRHEVEGGLFNQDPFLQASVHITRQELDTRLADLGEFACQCLATTSTARVVASDTARVRLAYIRKHFHQAPAPERVPEGRTIQLPCVPPDADPRPEIVWRKDGQEISGYAGSTGDSNLVLASDGSLIISATRLSDSANYSCEAVNIANRRTTDPVQLLVYVDGQWSPWSPWQGTCPSSHTVDCEALSQQLTHPNSPITHLPQQRRTRVCNNPAPLNGGAHCGKTDGQEEQLRLCEHICTIDGGWSDWSAWLECNAQCKRLRSRECNAPAPVNGGVYCQGRDSQWSNCTEGLGNNIPKHCLAPTSQLDYAQPRVVGPSVGAHQQLYVLASLGCVAFLLMVIAGLIAALLCRQRKGGRKSSKTLAISPTGSGGIFLEEKGEKLYFPELQHVRTVLLSQHQQRALLCDYSGVNSPAKSMLTRASTPNAKFYTMTSNGGSLIHHTASTGHNNNYTIRSAKSYGTNSNGYTANRRMAGSRTALIPEYSSSNASSANGGSASGLVPTQKMVVLGRGAVGQLLSPEDESNYATLYDSVVCATTGSEGSVSCSDKLAPSLQTNCTAELDEEGEFSGGGYSNSTSNEPINQLLTEEEHRLQDQTAATIVAAQVDSEGSRIELKRSGVALSIGEDTFYEQRTIFLAVSDNITERPKLTENETWLSSVIICAPCQQAKCKPIVSLAGDSLEEESLRRPVVLSFEHCASLFPKDNWQFVVYGQPLVPDQPWEVICRLGEENINTPVYVQLERQRCHLMTDHFGRFLLAGRPKRAAVAAQKRVHLAAYCSVSSEEISGIRVYCVPEMFMTVETVRQQEDEHRGVLLAEAEGFLMRPTGSLCCCLEDISEGYALEQSSSQYLEIPEEQHQWCVQNGLHFSLNLKPMGTPKEGVEEGCPLISGRIVIYQKGNPSERQILCFKLLRSELDKRRRRCSSSSSFPYPSLSQTNLHGEVEVEEKHVSTQFQLSVHAKKMLSSLLDCNPNAARAATFSANAGWTTLARKLGFDRYIQYFATHPGCSPTSLVLELWEACVGDSERALLDLLQNLRVMGRADAVLVLENYLAGSYGFDGVLPPPPPTNSLNSSAANSNHAIKSLIQ